MVLCRLFGCCGSGSGCLVAAVVLLVVPPVPSVFAVVAVECVSPRSVLVLLGLLLLLLMPVLLSLLLSLLLLGRHAPLHSGHAHATHASLHPALASRLAQCASMAGCSHTIGRKGPSTMIEWHTFSFHNDLPLFWPVCVIECGLKFRVAVEERYAW